MTTIPSPQPEDAFEPAEPASECFSLRQRMIDLGEDPSRHLRIAHTMLSSGLRLDIKRYNPRFPMADIHSG